MGEPQPVSALHGRGSGDLLDAVLDALPEAPAQDDVPTGPRRVALVGRPNVGKSTLFNRLVGKRVALVDDRPGVTRDRREGDGKLLGLEFRVFDTAGYEDEDPQSLPGRMRAQTEISLKGADAAPIPLHPGAERYYKEVGVLK